MTRLLACAGLLFCLITVVPLAAQDAPSASGGQSFRQEFLARDAALSPADLAQSFSADSTPASGKKSSFLAVAASIILPGMGEWYAGRLDRGQYPLIAEGVLWLGFAGLNMYSGWIQDDARLFAGQRAGVQLAGKSDEYFGSIGNYNSLADYNAQKLVERNLGALYPEDPAAGFGWKWNSVADRESYKAQRIDADEMANAAGFVALGLAANRI